MPSTRRFSLALPLISLFFFLCFGPLEARADPLAITAGYYQFVSPFQTVPRYVTYGFDLQGGNVRARGGEGDGPGRRVGSNCGAPCLPGSSFSLSASNALSTTRPTSILQINGQDRFGFMGDAIQFDTGSVTIPLNAGQSLTLTAAFTMTGTLTFAEYDLQRTLLTGFTYNSAIFGSGIAEISLFFSSTTHDYQIGRVTYNFQPSAVPEPATLILLGSGLAGVAARLRRRRAK